MRILNYKGQKLKVYEHFITKNFWEYYILDNNKNEDIRTALVMGFETEIGDVSMKEISPYIISRTTDLNQIMPVEGSSWLD